MCIAYILICISIIVLVYILLNEYKIKNMNDKMNNQTEEFYPVSSDGSRPGGGYGRTGGRLGHVGGGGYRNGRGNYYGGHGYGGGGYGYHNRNRNYWRRPYFNGWHDWYPFYSYDYYPNYTGDWKLCPQGTWCPTYLSCNNPYCM
jgi:hypothetical protein